MPLYEIARLKRKLRRAGQQVYVHPTYDDTLDQVVAEALIDAGVLTERARPRGGDSRRGEIHVESDFDDDLILHVLEQTTDSEQDGSDFRPLFNLEAQVLHGGGPVADSTAFWEEEVQAPASSGNMTSDEHGLLVTLGYDAGRLGIEVALFEHPGQWEQSDRFEWDLADWQRRPTLGFDPLTSEEIRPTKKQLADILVALDQALERR